MLKQNILFVLCSYCNKPYKIKGAACGYVAQVCDASKADYLTESRVNNDFKFSWSQAFKFNSTSLRRTLILQ